MRTEEQLQKKLCGWISISYPDVYFDSDPSGLRVGYKVRDLLMKTRSNHAHLDIILLKKSICGNYSGLALELKSINPFKQNGELKASEHLNEQLKTMELLRKNNFRCELVWSEEQGKSIIENYLGKSTVKDEPLFP